MNHSTLTRSLSRNLLAAPIFVVLVLIGVGSPAHAQEDALLVHTETLRAEERPIVAAPIVTAAPVLVSPDADLQKALQRMIDYPDLAWDLGIDGTGHVEIRIDTSGRITDATVVEGWGYGLDEAVLEAARRLRFTPALSGTRPVEVVAQFPLTLSLR